MATRTAHGGKVCPALKYVDRAPGPNTAGGVSFGLSLSQKHARGHPDTVTRQTAFDFNEIIDRDYMYFAGTNDDGWLVGGGEPESSWKQPMPDCAHITMMEIGSFDEASGGMSEEAIVELMNSGNILIPRMEVTPNCVELNPDTSPEVEVRFHFVKVADKPVEQWTNWQLKFLQNQLLEHIACPLVKADDHFHMTVARKCEFRSEALYQKWQDICGAAVARWQAAGPQPLINPDEPDAGSGFWMYRDRNRPKQFFAPNFFPPYDTEEKRAIIERILNSEHGKSCGF